MNSPWHGIYSDLDALDAEANAPSAFATVSSGDAYTYAAYLCMRVGACVWGLGLFVFHVLVIYALAISHTQAMLDTCGPSLWIFMLVHFLLPLLLLCLLCCAILCIYMLAVNFMVEAKQFIGYYMAVVLGALVYSAVLCGVGAHLTAQAAGNPECRSAMPTLRAGESLPLLTTLGWVYVALDGAAVLVSMAVMAALGYVHYFLP
jgi:hypothetical protein